MPNGFGYEPQPQSPSPDPVKVGMMLRKMRMGQSTPELEAMAHSPSAMDAMRFDVGARVPDRPQQPGSLQHDAVLSQLGLSPWEIQMLRRSGGIR